jgi:vacuolar-type H+-ATPase subunit H
VREVIRRVIEAEDEGRRLVESARAEAERTVADARKRARDSAEAEGRAAQAEAARIVAEAVAAAGERKRSDLASIAETVETETRMPPAARQSAVEAVVRCVCGAR